MAHSEPFFPETYTESRAWFRRQLEVVKKKYPHAKIQSRALKRHPQLTTDWITAASTGEQCLILSTALHGVEGFTGTAVLHHFIHDFLPQIDPERTAITLIHAVNPWGMQHRRRWNESNVDLNRNFRFGDGDINLIQNSGYQKLRWFLHPRRPLGNFATESARYTLGAIFNMARYGIPAVRQATLYGQTEDADGLYYGGRELQDESRLAMELLASMIQAYQRVVHIDMHTGYGPVLSLNLINSVLEAEPPEVWRARFDYPGVISADPEAFYAIEGDWIDALYRYTHLNAPGHSYYGTAFEFGTMGAGVLSQMRALKAVIFDNQISRYGVKSGAVETRVRREFRALFDPPHAPYRQEVIRSSNRALSGIMRWLGDRFEGRGKL